MAAARTTTSIEAKRTEEKIMATNELTSRGSSLWLNEWWRPFLWITLTPIVTVPVSAIVFGALIRQPEEVGFPPNNPQSQIDLFQGGSCDSFLSSPCYEYAEAVPTLLAFALPGLLNLAPIAWVLSKNIRVKVAALVALLLGALRLAIPVLVLMLGYETVANSEGTSYFRWDTLDFIFPSEPTFPIWVLGALAWVGCLVAWAMFGGVISVLGRAAGRGVACRIGWTVLGVIAGVCLFLGGGCLLLVVTWLSIGGEVSDVLADSVLVSVAIASVGAAALWFLYRRGHQEAARHVP
jgi:hypothetical protein